MRLKLDPIKRQGESCSKKETANALNIADTYCSNNALFNLYPYFIQER